ncbi:MAG: hypothetical protein V1770_05925 [bacterium]
MYTKKTLLVVSILFLPIILSGCFQLGDNKDFGAVFKSSDGGATSQQKALVSSPQANFISISNVDVLTMELDPQDHKAIYIGTLSDGLFYSYDGAESWNKALDLGNYKINTIAVNPDNKCNIYAASFNKIFMSKDCNRTYREIYNDPRPQAQINKLTIDFFDTSKIFAGTSNGDILESRDGGLSWHNLYDFKASVKDISIDKTNNSIIYIATANELHKTLDGGINWQGLNEKIKQALPKNASTYVKKIIQIYSPDIKGITVLTDKNIFITVNGGDTWSDLKLVTPPGKVKLYSLAINPQNHREIYYGTATSLVRSNDGGKTWTSSELPSSRVPLHILVDPSFPNILYMGMYKIES